MLEVLVNRLGGLRLPRKSVVRLTDRPDMTLDVYRGRKTTIQQQQLLVRMDKQWYNRCILLCTYDVFCRVATVREKFLENEIFPRSGKSQGILWMAREIRKDFKSQGKVREFGNKWLWQAVFRKFILFKRGKDVHSHEMV